MKQFTTKLASRGGIYKVLAVIMKINFITQDITASMIVLATTLFQDSVVPFPWNNHHLPFNEDYIKHIIK